MSAIHKLLSADRFPDWLPAPDVQQITRRVIDDTDWSWLRRVAARSPEDFARRIVKRNDWGLQRVWEVRRWQLDHPQGGDPEPQELHWLRERALGCPHCRAAKEFHGHGFLCMHCCWRATDKRQRTDCPCCNCVFAGTTLSLINDVGYGTGSIEVRQVRMARCGEQAVRNAAGFLLAHIEWGLRRRWWATRPLHSRREYARAQAH